MPALLGVKGAIMGCKTIGRFTYDNATGQALAANAPIQFTNITVSTDCLSCDGTSISIRKPGAYLVLYSSTLVADAAGTVETQGFRNGNAMPGMHAIDTAAAADIVSQAYAQPVTVGQNSGEVTLSFRTVTAATERIASVTVIKVA